MKIFSSVFFIIIFQIRNTISSPSFLIKSLSYLSSPFLKSIINKKNFSLPIYDIDYSHNYIYGNNNLYDDGIYRKMFLKIIRDELEGTNLSQSNTSQSCLNVINKYLFGHTDPLNNSYVDYNRSSYHLIKFLDDSSKSKNFLGSYDNCMLKTYKIQFDDDNKKNETRSTYVVITVDRTDRYNEMKDNNESILNISKIMDFEKCFYLIAICLPQGYEKINSSEGEYCTDDDYLKLLKYINVKLGDVFRNSHGTYNIFTIRKNPHKSEEDSSLYILICLLPFLFFAIQSFLIIFRDLFLIIFKKIFFSKKTKNGKKKENEIGKNKMKYSLDDSIDNDDERISDVKATEKLLENNSNKKLKILIQISDCFCFTENAKELFNFSLTSTKYNNDSGLSNVRGINGISIFFMIIGWTFAVLFNSPVRIYNPFQISSFLEGESLLSLFVMWGIRYAPRIIISCNGYILIYKYISFLERNITNTSEGLFPICLKFFIYQSYKYILLILLLLFERYSLYQIYIYFFGNTPIWKYFHLNILQKPKIGEFLLSFIILKYMIPGNEEYKKEGNNLLHYFWLPFNEIFFFIFGVILITIGYKKKYRIDKFILFLIPLLFIFKVTYSYLIKIIYAKKDFPFKRYIPTYYFIFLNYGRFMINPLFNLPYFLIGMYFGLMNYTIQKGILNLNKSDFYSTFSLNQRIFSENKKEDDNESNHEDNDLDDSREEKINNNIKKDEQDDNNNYCIEVAKMPFLITPIIFVQWHRKQKIIHLLAMLLIFFIFFIFFSIIYYIPNDIEVTMTNSLINFIYRIDIEFVVIFVQWGALIIFLKANNFAAIFLSHIFWTLLSKPYFSFILTINTVLLFIFYQSETMIEINTMNVLLNSMIGGAVTFIFTCLFYIFFELPSKRLIHLLFTIKNNKKEIDDIDNNIQDEDEKISEDNDKELEDKEKNE